MSTIKNPQKYDTKLPTNVRIREDLKQKAYEEVKTQRTTLSKIINDALEQRYNDEGCK